MRRHREVTPVQYFHAFPFRTLVVLLAFVPPILVVSWWAFAGGEEETAVIGTVVFAVTAVCIGSRAVVYLNTRM
jgi:hypothetical protein